MAEIVKIHPQDPQPRLIERLRDQMLAGALIAYPTDSSYALGCTLGNQKALDRIRRIRETDKHHNFTLVCKDLAEIASYARVDNWAFRLLKSFTPGPYTFILRATAEVPKKLQHPKRRTIGIRVPDHAVVSALLDALPDPILSSTLLLPGEDIVLTDPWEIDEAIGSRIDVIVDCGMAGMEPTSVLDLSSGEVQVLRRGKGDVSVFD